MESGIHHLLHPNCYHRIIYAKFKLKVYYPPPYEREVWDYQNVDFNAIKNATTEFSWERAFENLSIDEKVYFFLTKLSKTLSNYIPQLQLMAKIHLGLTKCKIFD